MHWYTMVELWFDFSFYICTLSVDYKILVALYIWLEFYNIWIFQI